MQSYCGASKEKLLANIQKKKGNIILFVDQKGSTGWIIGKRSFEYSPLQYQREMYTKNQGFIIYPSEEEYFFDQIRNLE
jgi:hypothetical protein